MLQSMGSQRVGHDGATEQQETKQEAEERTPTWEQRGGVTSLEIYVKYMQVSVFLGIQSLQFSEQLCYLLI